MLAKRIIPCLDVTAGRVVKGVSFVELRDAGEALADASRAGIINVIAGHFEREGLPLADPEMPANALTPATFESPITLPAGI